MPFCLFLGKIVVGVFVAVLNCEDKRECVVLERETVKRERREICSNAGDWESY